MARTVKQIPVIFIFLFFALIFKPDLSEAGIKPFILPVSGQIIRFYTKNVHRGVDIACQPDKEVRAAGDGRVMFCGFTPAGGNDSRFKNTVSIIHPNGLKTTYLGFKEISVKPETDVRQGQIIGIAGNLNSGKGNYIHFGIIEKKDTYLDPLIYAEFVETDNQSHQLDSKQKTFANPLARPVSLEPSENTKIQPASLEEVIKQEEYKSSGNNLLQKKTSFQKKKSQKLDLKKAGSTLTARLDTVDKIRPQRIINASVVKIEKNYGKRNINLKNLFDRMLVKERWKSFIWAAGIVLLVDLIRKMIKDILASRTFSESYNSSFGNCSIC